MEVYGATGQAITVGRGELRVRRAGESRDRLISAAALNAPEDDPISYLIAVVRGKIKPNGLSALDTNVTVTKILEAARESARTGRAVRLQKARSSLRD
jgi:glucose-fructose oxidoreductase